MRNPVNPRTGAKPGTKKSEKCQAKCQAPRTKASIKCSFEQTTHKNSDRGMSQIRQQQTLSG